MSPGILGGVLDAPLIRRQLVEHYRNELRRIAQLAGRNQDPLGLGHYRAAMADLDRAAHRSYRTEAGFIAEMERIRTELRTRLAEERTRHCD